MHGEANIKLDYAPPCGKLAINTLQTHDTINTLQTHDKLDTHTTYFNILSYILGRNTYTVA